MNICENCTEKSMCDQIKYECPLKWSKGIAYKFNNSKGEEFVGYFKEYDEAKEFAYRTGLCCLGRV